MTNPKGPDTPDDSGSNTPQTPSVIDIGSRAPTSSIVRATKYVAAISVVTAALVFAALEKGPKTPRPPKVVRKDESEGGFGGTLSSGESGIGGDEHCGRDPEEMHPQPHQLFGIDGTHVKTGKNPEPLGAHCEYPTDSQNADHVSIVGHEFIDAEGHTQICSLTPIWAPDDVMFVAGRIDHDLRQPGVIKFSDGVFELRSNVFNQEEGEEPGMREIQVEGEAALAVFTTGRVSVALLPEGEADDEKGMRLLVSAQEGKTTIRQDEREEQIELNGCEERIIPLDIQELQGCYIVEPGADGTSSGAAGKYSLMTGAVLLALRKRRKAPESRGGFKRVKPPVKPPRA